VNSDGSLVLDPRAGLDALIEALLAEGFRVLGPVLRDAVIAYDEIATGDDLPTGCAVDQAPGRYRLHRTESATRFGYTPGAASWKQFVFPSEQEVLHVRRTDGSFVVTHPAPPDRPLALIGARDCEVRALDVLDRVMLDHDHPDPRYAARRDGTFVVAVTCGVPAATCWCTSMDGGPEPQHGFDVRLTELDDAAGHRLLAEAGTERGAALLARVAASPAESTDRAAADAVVAHATAQMPQRLPGADLPSLLAGTELHPQWDDVAARCLSCGNCTMVCPTCFCSTFADSTSLEPDVSVRTQEWASCFQLDHSNLGGRPVRATTANRYRQWLTHKLATWPEQFGTTGCVGCGRCTTWCPAGIDIVEEAAALCTAADGRGTA
jgi:ferredoxin